MAPTTIPTIAPVLIPEPPLEFVATAVLVCEPAALPVLEAAEDVAEPAVDCAVEAADVAALDAGELEVVEELIVEPAEPTGRMINWGLAILSYPVEL